ncbi:MAG: Mitochondrial-processing peptidase subunit alpha [Watsoniomyces obsoletus]|nr:MAG: Mitochondrial-processing peptidase subunit alpha [Watsoniomyces obsoletus]
MSNPTADWEKVGESFFRKIQLYTAVFDDDLELENYVVAAAPYGGAIALYRDEDKLHAYRGAPSAKASIDIYSCAGKSLRQITWDKGSIKGLGWSEDEQLIIVTKDGTVRCYHDLQGEFSQFSLGKIAEDVGVKSCRFWMSGLVALLNNNRLVVVSRYDEPRPKLLATPPDALVHSWTLIPPAYTLSLSVEVLLAINETIYVVDPTDCEDRMLQNGPFTHVVASPNGRLVALHTHEGRVWIITSDFQDKLNEYYSGVKTMPKDVQWCGNDAVMLAWEDEAHLIGVDSGGVAAKYFFKGFIHLCPDVDGLRILSNDACELVQKVPEPVKDVFHLGSSSPAAVLLDAIDQLDKRSPKADDNIRLIQSRLTEAVDTCVRAAGHEFSIHWQKQLLKAASFGKSVLDLYNSDDFVEMCETLRVLNAVRFYEVGMPVSYEEYIRLTPEGVVHRLINRGEYLLALRVSEYLRLPTERIYVRWASQKVRVSSEDEESICRTIVTKLNGKRGIAFEEIARTAYDEGRGRLATQLLNYEVRAANQVPLLLQMEEGEVALDKAIQSGDTDLIYFVLLHLRGKLPLAAFFRVINKRSVATALVESSARAQDTELLKDLYYQDDRRLDGAYLHFQQALIQKELTPKLDKLKLAQRVLQDSKDHILEIKCLEEEAKLWKLQDGLTKELPESFMGLSVNQTLYQLIRLGYTNRAKKCQAEFRVPERMYWWIRLRALVAKRDWGELEEWGKGTRRSPIGWEPFATEILSAGNPKLASSFIPKCSNAEERIDLYVKCGMVLKAAEEAFKIKDVEKLEELRGKVTAGGSSGAGGTAEIERMITKLRPK